MLLIQTAYPVETFSGSEGEIKTFSAIGKLRQIYCQQKYPKMAKESFQNRK